MEGYCHAIMKQQAWEIKKSEENSMFGNAVERWSKKTSKTETLGLLLTSCTTYGSG